MAGSQSSATTRPSGKLLAAVALISGAQLLLELVLTRVFSVTLYYHFAFLVVSLALFGIGVAGVAVTVLGWGLRVDRIPRTMAWCCLGFALATVLALAVVVSTRLPAGGGWKVLASLAWLYLVAALPFVFGGACLAMAMTGWADRAGRVYFWDLGGAAAGCLATIPLLDLLGGLTAVLVAGALGATAALLLVGRRRLLLAVTVVVVAAAWLLVVLDAGLGLFKVPSVKAIDEKRVLFARWNSHSRITVMPGEKDFLWMNIDSDAATRIFTASAWQDGRRDNLRFSETRLASLVYELGFPGPALIIGPGGGADIIAAHQKGVRSIVGVEINDIIVDDVMLGRFADYAGHPYEQEGIRVLIGEGRSTIRRSRERFAYIQATLVDTWAATSAGAFTLSENTLYTVEAFSEFISHLRPQGVLSMTRWLRQPPREFVRLAAIGVAALYRLGLQQLSRHFFVAADARMASLLLKATPFSDNELQLLRTACRRDGLRVLFDPATPPRDLLGKVITTHPPATAWADYPLDISPPGDDRPFFFYTVKPADFPALLLGRQRGPIQQAVELLADLLLVVAVFVLLFFLVPLALGRLAAFREHGRRGLLALAYFACLGMAFIALEMAWMQHFILFLGHPVYALSLVLFVLLLSTGVGSRLSERTSSERIMASLGRTVAALVLVASAYALFLGNLFRALVGWPLASRLLVSGLLLVLPGLLMGRMMPLGVRLLHRQSATALVPWAWGINGAASVFGSVGAVALSLNMGYRFTQFSAATIYLLGLLLLWWFEQRGRQLRVA